MDVTHAQQKEQPVRGALSRGLFLWHRYALMIAESVYVSARAAQADIRHFARELFGEVASLSRFLTGTVYELVPAADEERYFSWYTVGILSGIAVVLVPIWCALVIFGG
jgi:hypothetical protein